MYPIVPRDASLSGESLGFGPIFTANMDWKKLHSFKTSLGIKGAQFRVIVKFLKIVL